MSSETIVQHLRSKGHRLTPQRLVIMQILDEEQGHLTAQQIFERAAARMPGLTEATVYRTLDFLAQNGLALVAHVGEGKLVYENSAHSHHHLICRTCGHTVEISHDLLASVYEQFRAQTGYEVDCCHVTFFGLCPACKEPESPNPLP